MLRYDHTEQERLHVGVREKIEQAFINLELKLSYMVEQAGVSRSQMQWADPTGKRWPAFKQHIHRIRTKKLDSLSAEDERLASRLIRLSDSDLETFLHFAFLDRCFGRLSTSVLRDKSNMAIDLRYPTEWYPSARTIQREVHLHVGPTNSGKTYNALKRLRESGDGFYAGPLRLLAHEVYSRFHADGIPCDLVTGDDVRLDPADDTKLSASTVEMVSCSRACEVAVIDEIQMMADDHRGWAWTRAFLGAVAKEVHLCGESRMVPLIKELAASMGDTLHVHHYDRLNPLKSMSRSLRGDLSKLQKGDCIVAFSIVGIHALKRQIEKETGRRCAIVYGSLPPETRAQQAELFNNPDNDYDFLVASDAVGMGLNLSIKRMIFESVRKHNGKEVALLEVAHLKQIAGRAGRYRTSHQAKSGSDVKNSPGLVTCIDERDLPMIQKALSTEPPAVKTAGIIPPAEYFEAYSNTLPPGVPFEYIMGRVCEAATIHPRFKICDVTENLDVARLIEDIHPLTTEQRVMICACPVGRRDTESTKCFRAMTRAIAEQKQVTVADIAELRLEILAVRPVHDRSYLTSLELLHKSLVMFLWLSYRFPLAFRDRDMAMHAKELTEKRINWTLRAFSANPRLSAKLEKVRARQGNMQGVEPEAELNEESGLSISEMAVGSGLNRTEKLNTLQGLDVGFDPEQMGTVKHEEPQEARQTPQSRIADATPDVSELNEDSQNLYGRAGEVAVPEIHQQETSGVGHPLGQLVEELADTPSKPAAVGQ